MMLIFQFQYDILPIIYYYYKIRVLIYNFVHKMKIIYLL